MKYVKENEENVVIYDVSYNEEKLKELKEEITFNCGRREHHSYETDYLPYINNIVNYKQKYVGKKEYFEETRDVYQVDYDKILEPQLSTLIDSFIKKGDLSLFDYLYNGYDFIDLYDARKEKIFELKCKLKDMVENDEEIARIKVTLDKLNELVKNIKEDEKLKDQREYLEAVKNEIVLTKEDEMDYETYNRVLTLSRKLLN